MLRPYFLVSCSWLHYSVISIKFMRDDCTLNTKIEIESRHYDSSLIFQSMWPCCFSSKNTIIFILYTISLQYIILFFYAYYRILQYVVLQNGNSMEKGRRRKYNNIIQPFGCCIKRQFNILNKKWLAPFFQWCQHLWQRWYKVARSENKSNKSLR